MMLRNRVYYHPTGPAAYSTGDAEPSFFIPEKMRALVLDGTGFDHLQIREMPVPRPGPEQILARVDAAGICTSNIKLVEQGPKHSLLYGWDLTRYPLILGDEGSVTLVEVGDELRGQYRSGERYVIQPAIDHPPINHRERYRDDAKGVEKIAVSYTLAGHLAEYILITEEILAGKCLIPLPDKAIPYAHAAMAEPLSCVISAQDHHLHLTQEGPLAARGVMKGLKPGGVTLIIGSGAMGRMHVDLALSYRPRAIVATDLIGQRLERVRQLFGARAEKLGVALHAVNPSTDDVQELVNALTDHRGADDVIVAVGSGRAIEVAQDFTARGAVLNLFGGLKKGEDIVELDTSMVHYQEVNVTGSSGGSPWDVARTLELMASGEINAGAHVTRIGDLDHAIEFLEMVKAQEIDGKAVVYPHRRTDEIMAVSSWAAEDERVYLGGNGS
jgi:threonine dehydrogenase-like Zn-dependent dehydrogenase